MSLAVKKADTVHLPDWVRRDVYWSSSLYILGKMAQHSEKFKSLIGHYVDLENYSISFTKMKNAASKWSTSEKIMISMAAHLFNEVHRFNLSDLDYLDAQNKEVAQKALQMRFFG